MVLKYKGDTITVSVGISNEADSESQDYGISIEMRDVNNDIYEFKKVSALLNAFTGTFTKQISSPPNKVKIYMAKGSSYTFTFAGQIPDIFEGGVDGKITIYESELSTSEEIISTDWDSDVFTYQKKKLNLSLSATWA